MQRDRGPAQIRPNPKRMRIYSHLLTRSTYQILLPSQNEQTMLSLEKLRKLSNRSPEKYQKTSGYAKCNTSTAAASPRTPLRISISKKNFGNPPPAAFIALFAHCKSLCQSADAFARCLFEVHASVRL